MKLKNSDFLKISQSSESKQNLGMKPVKDYADFINKLRLQPKSHRANVNKYWNHRCI